MPSIPISLILKGKGLRLHGRMIRSPCIMLTLFFIKVWPFSLSLELYPPIPEIDLTISTKALGRASRFDISMECFDTSRERRVDVYTNSSIREIRPVLIVPHDPCLPSSAAELFLPVSVSSEAFNLIQDLFSSCRR